MRIAAQKACAAGYEVTAHYHVGDTPQDILAAEEGGATAIGCVVSQLVVRTRCSSQP